MPAGSQGSDPIHGRLPPHGGTRHHRVQSCSTHYDSYLQGVGRPLADDKTEGPITELSFLGIQLNSTRMLTSLLPDKLSSLRMMVKGLVGARVVRKKQALESLVSHLVHAAMFFPLGKEFLNALFATKAAVKPGRVGRLNLAAHSELA